MAKKVTAKTKPDKDFHLDPREAVPYNLYDPMKWKLKSSEPIFKSPFISLYNNTYKLPDGKVKKGYYHISRPDYVLVLAVSDKERLVVIKQYRRGIDDYVYELPAGWIDKNETPMQAAIRKLKEETGFTSTGTETMQMYPQAGFSSMKAYLALVHFQENTSNEYKDLSNDENISFTLKPVSEIINMINQGKIRDMGFLGALGIYFSRKKIHYP